MSASHPNELVDALKAAGLVTTPAPSIRPLPGGVSSDIVLVEDGNRRFVVKRALAKLRVRDDWFADTSRNATEFRYFRRVGTIIPEAVPRILGGDPDAGWFAMDYLAGDFTDLKSRLMRGIAEPEHARRAGGVLGTIHGATWGDAAIAAEFDTWKNFHQLRVEPYLETSARRVPDLATFIFAEAASLERTRLALVHGDYSPKNLLVAPGRLVVLDAEVAWFGDPAFDTAFFLTHLHLKALRNAAAPSAFLALVPEFWNAYTAALGSRNNPDLEARTVRLTLCIILARVHGKSPVEYLTDPARQQFITTFVRTHLPNPPAAVRELTSTFSDAFDAR